MAVHHLARRDTANAAAPHEVANYAPLLLWSIWVVTVVSGLFLGLRVYCKVTRHRSMWWDDWFLVLSWVSHSEDEMGVANQVGTKGLRSGFHGHADRGHEMGHRPTL